MKPDTAETGEEKATAFTEGLEQQTWKDIKYSCRKCGNSWISLEYLKEIHRKLDSEKWNWKHWERTQRTVVFNFNRVRAYPNDFRPIEQFCPVCNEDMKVELDSLKGDLYVEKIEKKEEPADYVKQIADIAPHGWKTVSTK